MNPRAPVAVHLQEKSLKHGLRWSLSVRRPIKGNAAEQHAHRIFDGPIMNRLVSHISKSLALLAAIVLPVLHPLTATYCCQGGQDRVVPTFFGMLGCCCSLSETDCRHSERNLGLSPDENNLKPCQCPVGCRGCNGITSLGGVDVATAGSSLEDDLAVGKVLCVSGNVDENTAQSPSANALVPSPTSGSERCVQLCRYRL